jgi:hypothetical protein
MAQTCADIGTCGNEGLQPITVPVGVPEEFDQFGKRWRSTATASSWVSKSETWNSKTRAQVARLFAPTPQVGAELGHAIAVSGEWIVVGSHFEGNARGTDASAVYSFRPK